MNTCNLLPRARWIRRVGHNLEQRKETKLLSLSAPNKITIQLGCQIPEKRDRKGKIAKCQIFSPEKVLHLWFSKDEGGGQRFGTFPKIHPFWRRRLSLREAMLATNSGLTKLILYQCVVRTDRDLTNYVKWWNSIMWWNSIIWWNSIK